MPDQIKGALRDLLPEGDNLATLAVMLYAAIESYGVDLPALDLSGASGFGPLLVLGGVAAIFVRNRIKARFDQLEELVSDVQEDLRVVYRMLRDSGAGPKVEP